MKITRNPLSLIVLLLLFALSCGKTNETHPRHIFLLQKTGTMEIVKTPDLKKKKLNKKLKSIIRNRSIDAGLPPSPLLKKIKILTKTRNALFAPANSTYDFPVKVKKGAKLQFGFAIADMYLKYRRVPVAFNIRIKEKGEKEFRLLFQEYLFPGSTEYQGWRDRVIPLKNSEEEIVLCFETEKRIEETLFDNDIFAYWSNPVIINPVDKQQQKPKLILISLDTLRADHLEMYGYKRQTMPEVVRLSKDFVKFNNCWSQWCWTTESHQSIMTGLYEVEHLVPRFYAATPKHLETLADVMKSGGYLTSAFTGAGKVGAHTGLCKGFDSYFDNEFRKRGGFELLGTWLRTKEWLTQNAGNDFFLFFHTYEIHAPYRTHIPEYEEMFKTHKGMGNLHIFELDRKPTGEGLDRTEWYRKSNGKKITAADIDVIQGFQDYYDGSIRYTNDYFFRDLTEHLKSLGIYDNTMIVVLSDHGEEFFEHGRFKHFDGLYEEYIHVPLFIKFPASRYGGSQFDANVETIDVMPTILEALDIPLKHKISGRSLMRLIKSGKQGKKHRDYVFSQSSAKFTVKKNNIKLLLRGRVDHQVRDELNRIEIFDLNKDAGEQNPIKVDDLSEHLSLYDTLYRRLIQKKIGIHIVFPAALKGKAVEGVIDVLEGSKVKTFFEIGVAHGDRTGFRSNNKQILFKWKLSGWRKSLILIPGRLNPNNLKVSLKLKIDGMEYDLARLVIDPSLKRKGNIIQLLKKTFDPDNKHKTAEVFLFGNGLLKKSAAKTYFPGISKKNLEKLKELGYIN
jgi:arylsulfatase A-like enzyme